MRRRHASRMCDCERQFSSVIAKEETIMTSYKTALAAAALALCFGAAPAMAQTTTTPAAPAAPDNSTLKGGTPENDTNASATVVAKCTAEAEKQGLQGDAKGTFMTDCEKKAGKQ